MWKNYSVSDFGKDLKEFVKFGKKNKFSCKKVKNRHFQIEKVSESIEDMQ
jgi:hypothetical protein